MKFKKISTLLLSAALTVLSFNVHAADVTDTIKLTIGSSEMLVNGQAKEIDPGRDTSPVIRDGRTLVPIRSVIEAMGGTVEWVAEESKVVLKINDDVISLVIDSTVATLNGAESTLDVAPAIINDRTMLPIRYIAESFKFNVDWNQETSVVTITKEIKEEIIEEDYFEEDYFEDDYFEDDYFEDDYFEDDYYEDDYYEDDYFEDDYYEDDYYEDDYYDEEF